MLVSSLAICFSETSVDFHLTTRNYIPKNKTLRNHRLSPSDPTTSQNPLHAIIKYIGYCVYAVLHCNNNNIDTCRVMHILI
jgi:hypothetical protein